MSSLKYVQGAHFLVLLFASSNHVCQHRLASGATENWILAGSPPNLPRLAVTSRLTPWLKKSSGRLYEKIATTQPSEREGHSKHSILTILPLILSAQNMRPVGTDVQQFGRHGCGDAHWCTSSGVKSRGRIAFILNSGKRLPNRPRRFADLSR